MFGQLQRGSVSRGSGYLAEDTIAAIATAVGGPVAIVRVSGPGAGKILQALAPGAAEICPREVHLSELVGSEGRALDQALVVRFQAPASFTGEDVVEFHVHGGALIVQRVLERVVEVGARPALPGEFSFRAVRNGRMSLSQARAVAEMIQASSDQALDLAFETLTRHQDAWLIEVSESLRRTLSLCELGIDFSDQDEPEVELAKLQRELLPAIEGLSRLAETFERGKKIKEGVKLVFLGLPNAGKSSLFNALLGEDRSIVTEVPGTTRDVIRERLVLAAGGTTILFKLEDTAGIRRALDVVEDQGIQRTRQAAQKADLILWVVDPTQSFEESRRVFEEMPRKDRVLAVMTKSDLDVSRVRQREIEGALGLKWLKVSAKSGEGIADLAGAIAEKGLEQTRVSDNEVVLQRLDEWEAVRSARDHLRRGLEAKTHELLASDLRQALHGLSPWIGATLPDDILEKIFGQFCIGK